MSAESPAGDGGRERGGGGWGRSLCVCLQPCLFYFSAVVVVCDNTPPYGRPLGKAQRISNSRRCCDAARRNGRRGRGYYTAHTHKDRRGGLTPQQTTTPGGKVIVMQPIELRGVCVRIIMAAAAAANVAAPPPLLPLPRTHTRHSWSLLSSHNSTQMWNVCPYLQLPPRSHI